MRNNIYLGLFFIASAVWLYACRERIHTLHNSTSQSQQAYYESVRVSLSKDTIHFALQKNMYNVIKSFNVFAVGGIEYISFFDERATAVNIYRFKDRHLVKQIKLDEVFHGHSLYKPSVYTLNFDSIFINNRLALFLVNGNGKVTRAIDFQEKPIRAMTVFDNDRLPVVKGNILYAAVRPSVNERSLDDLRRWKTMCCFDLSAESTSLHYPLPILYQTNLYGYSFLEYSYCFNNRGHFVFSFAADTNLYETDLDSFQIAHIAKSQFQTRPILPLSTEQVKDPDVSYREYKKRDSYGPVYFDPFHKRYIRVAKSGAFAGKEREYRFIIFNEELQIIGESVVPDGVSYGSLFFTANGDMYSRVNASDEYALHFVRLEYEQRKPLSETLAQQSRIP